MSTLFERLTSQLTTRWINFSKGQKILATAGAALCGVIFSVASYVTLYRIKEKSKKFNSYTTSDEAIDGKDLSNKYCIVTGCNTGIGKETAKILYKQGCNVIMACRNIEKANKARNDIINEISSLHSSTSSIIVMKLDLSSLQSVRDFAINYIKKYNQLNYVINNAGIMALPEYNESKEKYELQFAVNHIAHFYLIKLLMPVILKNKARIIVLSSTAHRRIQFKDMDDFLTKAIKNNNGPSKTDYNPWMNYGISKTANILFARELYKRYSKDGVVAVSLHPGWVAGSDLSRNVKPKLSELPGLLQMFFNLPFIIDNWKTNDQGAANTLRCVSLSNNDIKGGHYYHNCESAVNTFKLQGAAKPRQYDNYEQDSLESRLWRLTEKLITQKGFELKSP